MNLIKLPIGTATESDLDCTRIEQIAANTFTLKASILAQCDDDETSESLIDSNSYPSYGAAEAAGIACADALCSHQPVGGGRATGGAGA